MDTPDIIFKLLKEQHRTQKELAEYLGVPQSTITDWKKRKTTSYNNYLKPMTGFFAVTLDYLMYGEERGTHHSKLYISGRTSAGHVVKASGKVAVANSDVSEVTEIFKSLSADGQSEALSYLRYLKNK